MTSILQKVQRENKTLFIMPMCDFSINLFNYCFHTETNDFINLMVSNYRLPHILHQTRVTDHSATIIDSIFSNNCELDTLSGNLLSQISDHFPQFLIIKNVTVEYRNCSLFQYDYSKFNEYSLINDFKELLWEDIDDVNLNLNGKLMKKSILLLFNMLLEKSQPAAIKTKS